MARYTLLAAILALGKGVSADTTLTTSSSSASTSPAEGTTYINLFVGGDTTMFPVTSMAGSIIDANALVTTITINCVKGNSVCNRISGAITAIQGPSTWSGHIVAQTNILGIQAIATVQSDCTITASTKFASCAETVMLVGKADGSAVTSTMSKEISVPSTDIAYESLFITAGLDKLNRPQATQTPGTAPDKVTANMALAAGGAVAGAAVALAEFL